MLNSAWIIDPSLDFRFENFEIWVYFVIYGWKFTRSGCNLTRCGWNLTRCGCNLIFEHLFFYLLKNWHYQVIEYCCSRVGSDGPSGHLAPFLLLIFLEKIENHLYLKEAENLEKFSEFWSMYLCLYFSSFNLSISQTN